MLSDRLRDLLSVRKLSINEFAELCDLPVETVRNIYYGKSTDPKISTVMKISNALNMNVNCLMGQCSHDNIEKEIVRHYQLCGNHGKSLIQLVAKYEAMLAKAEREAPDKHRIPCLVPIGFIDDGIVYNSCEIIEIETNTQAAYVGIKITTNNFAPSYCKNDIILCENRFPNSGERGVFYTNEKAYFRRFIEENGQYRLQCIHNRGNDFIFKRMDEIECVGTCIGVIRS